MIDKKKETSGSTLVEDGGELDGRIDDLVDRWHAGEGAGVGLREWLGMSRDQSMAWVNGRDLPGRYEVPSRAPGAGPLDIHANSPIMDNEAG